MNHETQSADRDHPKVKWLVISILMLLPLACMVSGPAPDRPRNGWDPAHGPLIPHDTFPTECELCHLGGNWHRIKADFTFDHLKETGIALEGGHRGAECLRCHNDRGPVAVFANRGCGGCHEDRHEGHMGPDCNNCHTLENWRPGEHLSRHNRTRFPLVGSHVAVACYRCHPGAEVSNFQRAATHCSACHADELPRASDPDHIAQGWTDNCESCHKPTSWNNGYYGHQNWPLVGHHRTTACSNCHVNGQFQGTNRDCYGCHTTEYHGTTNPSHTAAGFPTTCDNCHTPIGWGAAGYNHSIWPLTGAHAMRQCVECHVNNVYSGLSTACNSCHNDDYNSTTNPPHQSNGIPTSCESCHTTTAWGQGFVHRFPRTGPHNTSCVTCHTTLGNFTQFSCFGCHEHNQTAMNSEHNGVRNYTYSSAACYSCHPNGRN